MEKYLLVYQTVTNPVAEISFFKMKEGDFPGTFNVGVSHFYDDMDPDLIERLEPFLKKIGISNFEAGEHFTVHEVHEQLFIEIE